MAIYVVVSSGFLIAGWVIAYSIPDETVSCSFCFPLLVAFRSFLPSPHTFHSVWPTCF